MVWYYGIQKYPILGLKNPQQSLFRVGMVYGNQPQPWPSTRVPGPMVCKTDTGQKHTLMEVKECLKNSTNFGTCRLSTDFF